MKINPSHQRLAQRPPATVGTGGKGLAKVTGDFSRENKTSEFDAGFGAKESNQQPPSGGFTYDDPMANADTLMRAIMANYVEQKTKANTSELQSSQPQSGEDKALADITEQFQSRFKDNASDHDAFHSLMKKSFGESYDYSKAENIRQQTLNGDFSWMPKIETKKLKKTKKDRRCKKER